MKCPFCEDFDAHTTAQEVAHMETRHREVVAQRLAAAGWSAPTFGGLPPATLPPEEEEPVIDWAHERMVGTLRTVIRSSLRDHPDDAHRAGAAAARYARGISATTAQLHEAMVDCGLRKA